MIGIDQSLNSCAVVYTKDKKVVDCILIKSNKNDSVESRIKFVVQEVMKFIYKHKCLDIRIENLPYSAHSRSVRPLAGLYYHLLIILNDYFFKVKSIEPTSLKKFASGSGKASKQDMIDALPNDVLNKFNVYNNNKKGGLDDLADAYFLSLMA